MGCAAAGDPGCAGEGRCTPRGRAAGLAPYLLSVPGVGVVTAASLLGEAGDLTRYEDWRQLRKLAGYNLKENSSGASGQIRK